MPPRLKDIKRALRTFGVETSKPGTGSHWHLTKPGFTLFTVPAHNGLKSEITDKYIGLLCAHFRIDRNALLAAM
jgi:hypothetical protein